MFMNMRAQINYIYNIIYYMYSRLKICLYRLEIEFYKSNHIGGCKNV